MLQSNKEFKSSWRLGDVSMEAELKHLVSSAKRSARENWTSLMYTRNNSGPRMLPCGTPDSFAKSLFVYKQTCYKCVWNGKNWNVYIHNIIARRHRMSQFRRRELKYDIFLAMEKFPSLALARVCRRGLGGMVRQERRKFIFWSSQLGLGVVHHNIQKILDIMLSVQNISWHLVYMPLNSGYFLHVYEYKIVIVTLVH